MPNRSPSAAARRPSVAAAAALIPAAAVLAAAPAAAQPAIGGAVGVPAATVGVHDPATALVDQLLALVPVAGGIVGQRPYPTREVVRVALAARGELARRAAARGAGAAPSDDAGAARGGDRAGAARRLRPGRCRARARRDRRHRPAARLRLGARRGLGGGARAVRPRQRDRQHRRPRPPRARRARRPAGRPRRRRLRRDRPRARRRRLARLVAQPRASLVAPYDGGFRATPRWTVEPQRLFARATVRNVAVQAGVDDWAWGQGGAAGAFVSANARPLRALAVQSDTAFALPGRLRAAGRWRASALAADLGRRRTSRTPSCSPTR
jgi:hypothetical protein